MYENKLAEATESREYMAMVCHELKTPLTLLNAIIQLLDKKIGDNYDQSINKSISKADEQIRKMGNLINSFLNVAEPGDICLDCECFKLNHLIAEVAEQFRSTNTHPKIILDCTESIVINGDREKLGCVLSNILSNAIKYSPAGKFIYVKCFQTRQKAFVWVRDEGIGIEQKYINQIFEKRFRINEGNAGRAGGSGIGL
jgi:signal transduction histidine kinase